MTAFSTVFSGWFYDLQVHVCTSFVFGILQTVHLTVLHTVSATNILIVLPIDSCFSQFQVTEPVITPRTLLSDREISHSPYLNLSVCTFLYFLKYLKVK
ncbi:MAG: hypothetical protein AYK18_02520 [Theionarchaea archaeon DG-70]|nr:MAG: hypothetical protein AYK18_02520 [Theionarchaea archaeon DG-70]